MTDKQEEARPVAVPEAKQAGEVRARWAWVEPRVWTERMLTALEVGVKGGKWFSLIDKVSAPRVLLRAFKTKGWFAYFKHSHRYTFDPLDPFIRQRLRSLLRRRSRRYGIASGGDYRRWPNAFFAEQGLFSLCLAHAELHQSLKR